MMQFFYDIIGDIWSSKANWGGASFVEVSIGINLGFIAIKRLRDFIQISRKECEAHIRKNITSLVDSLKKEDVQGREAAYRFQSYLEEKITFQAVQQQKRIWYLFCSVAWVFTFIGIIQLYWDCFSAINFIFILTWPLYRFFSFCSLSAIKKNIDEKAGEWKNVLSHKISSPSAEIDEIVEQVHQSIIDEK